MLAALLAGFAALVALAGVGSHNVQQQLAQVAEPWGGPLHPITLGLVDLSWAYIKSNTLKLLKINRATLVAALYLEEYNYITKT